MNLTESFNPSILLDNNAHRYARQFASEQINPAKGKRVYLNTLAVYGVHSYFKCLDIPSNIAHSDCWQKGMRAMFDVADIDLPQGKLECVWLLPGQSEITIPLEAREDRLGYVIVQLEEELKKIEIIGFIPSREVQFDTESLNLSQLQPLENLFQAIAPQTTTNLSQWFNDVFTAEWRSVETILAGRITRSLATANPNLTAITRGKTIQWQIESLARDIILVLKMIPLPNNAIDLCLQIYPGEIEENLPAGLTVSILDASDRICLSAETKDTDDWIQLEFSCQPGEEFQVEMNLAGVSLREKFVV